MPESKRGILAGPRIAIDVSVAIFLFGISFNAGLEYNKVSQLENENKLIEARMDRIEADQPLLLERMAKVEQILQDIRDRLQENKK